MIEPTAETEVFWRELAFGRLVGRRCSSCATLHPYPRRFCPHCGSEEGEWISLPTEATVYSYTLLADAPAERPYLTSPVVIAIVEFEGGHRMLGLIDGPSDESLAIGQRVWFNPCRRGDLVLPGFSRISTEPTSLQKAR
jgi:uncharacterized OB-fold protein